jgi:hypothetical protein
MDMNNSYDEDNEVDQICIQQQSKINSKERKLSKIESRFNFVSMICKAILVLGTFYLFLYHIIDSTIHSGPPFDEQKDTTRRQLRYAGYRRHHKDPCIEADNNGYGCCGVFYETYYNQTLNLVHETKFTHGMARVKKDPLGSNCVSLSTLIDGHNKNYAGDDSCFHDSNYPKTCCKIDISADIMYQHKAALLNDEIKQYFTDKNYKYRYLIDSKESGCPSINSLMIEYDSNYNVCDAKYKACFWSNAGIIIIVFGITTVILLCAICDNKRRK